MSPVDRLRPVRMTLVAGIVLRGLFLGIAVAASLLAGAAIVDLAVPLSLTIRRELLVVSILAAVAVALRVWWRNRAVLSMRRVALWVEERFPALEYRLITVIETGSDAFFSGAPSDGWTATARRRTLGVIAAPAAGIAVAILVLLLLPGGAGARLRSPHAGDALDRVGMGTRAAGSRLTPLVAEVVPPKYSRQSSSTIDEPNDTRALVGSRLTLNGRGDADGVRATIGSDTVAATARGGRWSIVIRVPEKPVAIHLLDRGYGRIVALEPIADAVPVVTLSAPARDSVLRAPTGKVPLSADAHDDFEIVESSFEYIVSSGNGEAFTFRSGRLGAIRPNAKQAALSATLSLDALALKPGDIVHLRAVARDANDVTGPGIGASETRSLRIARAGEYDSIAVEAAAPPDEEKSMISQRMLIMLAEALQKKRTAMARSSLLGESHAIAVDQKRLRRQVGEIVFTRLGGEPSGEEHNDPDSPARAKTMEELLARADSATNKSTDPIDFEGGESPVVAVNKPLLEAYNAMWDASTELELGEPGRALPHMRRALAAVQKARLAERVYLRGTPPAVVIDVNNARLKGKDKGSSSQRRPLASADSATRARADRFARAVALAAQNPAAAVDSLLLLRVDALGDAPSFAGALSDAVSAMRGRRPADATTAFARARRALAGEPVVRDSLTRWGIVP